MRESRELRDFGAPSQPSPGTTPPPGGGPFGVAREGGQKSLNSLNSRGQKRPAGSRTSGFAMGGGAHFCCTKMQGVYPRNIGKRAIVGEGGLKGSNRSREGGGAEGAYHHSAIVLSH